VAPVVALSSMHSDERQRHAATLRRLRVRCLPSSHDWQDGTTHVVQPELKRSEKSLAGMAAGVWLVRQQWLADSSAAGRLLDPEPYELEGCETATGSIAQGRDAVVLCSSLYGLGSFLPSNCRQSSVVPPAHSGVRQCSCACRTHRRYVHHRA
jgi:hypothetical protein